MKRNEHEYLSIIAQNLAEIKGVDIETIAKITTHNAMRLFGLPLAPKGESRIV